jgi:hypothetical protein
MTYATISEISRRWQVDRATARIALKEANIVPSIFHASPRYRWEDILRKIENVSEEAHLDVNIEERLLCTNELADRLGVTAQTVRNYGRAGRLHTVKITDRTIRYMMAPMRKCESAVKTDDTHQM